MVDQRSNLLTDHFYRMAEKKINLLTTSVSALLSQVTVIYTSLYTMQIVLKQLLILLLSTIEHSPFFSVCC